MWQQVSECQTRDHKYQIACQTRDHKLPGKPILSHFALLPLILLLLWSRSICRFITIYFILLWGKSLSSSTMKSLTKIEDLLAKGVHTNRYRLTSAGLTVLSPSSSCEHSQVLQWLVSGHTYSHSTMKRTDKHSSLYTSGKTKIAPNDCHTIWSFLSCHRTNISSMSFGRFSSLCILGARPCKLDCGRFVVEPLWALNIVIALNTLVIP